MMVLKRCAVVILSIWSMGWANSEVTLDDETLSRSGVKTGMLRYLEFGEHVRMVGQVVSEPGSTFIVKSLLPGRVEKILVSAGQSVQPGQDMLVFHSHAYLDLQGRTLQALQHMKLSENRVRAGRELYEVKAISRVELENREQAALAARLGFERLKAELRDLGCSDRELDALIERQMPDPHMPVRAPIDGVVLSLDVPHHAWIDAFSTLITLGDPTKIELELQIQPERASSIAPGNKVEFFPLDRPQDKGRGTVISTVPRVDPETRTIMVRVKIDRPNPALYPGLFVQGRILSDAVRSIPTLPESAVIRIGDEDVVFIQKDANRFEARPVELGRFEGGHFEILRGVDSQDRVVVNGTFLLKSALVEAQAEEE